MTQKEIQERHERSRKLQVFEVADGRYLVESSNGTHCYKVRVENGESLCTCGDFTANTKSDTKFTCKHILAAMNANGDSKKVGSPGKERVKLDDRFIMNIQGREFVKYAGLLDLAHQMGLSKLTVEPIQFPSEENGSEAICKAVAESHKGEIFIDIGDANPKNTNRMIVSHILRMASTRAKARALRDMTNIGMTCLEELGDLEDVPVDETEKAAKKPPKNAKPQRPTEAGKKPADGEKKAADKPPEESAAKPNEPTSGPKIFVAQQRAIENLAKRRNITSEELEGLTKEQFGKTLQDLTSSEASNFITYLQKSA